MEQNIRFCTTSDGVRIAYATSGKGMPIVRPGHWLTHLQYDLKGPIWGHLIEGLSEQHQYVRYDSRGTGLSDRDVEHVGPELWQKDLEAVVNDLGLNQFALLGVSQGGTTAIRYCVAHPDRVSRLILYGAWARGRLRREGSEWQISTAMFEAMCTLIREGWGSDSESYRELFSSLYVPSGNRDHIRFLNELERVSAAPEMAEKYFRANAEIDVRNLLAQIKAPTLVLHCRGDRLAPFDLGRELASGIAGSKFVPMEGENHLFLEDEPAHKIFLEAVSHFLGDKRKLVSKSAFSRHARAFPAATRHLHHVIEPYYMFFFVASIVVGAVTFVLSRLI